MPSKYIVREFIEDGCYHVFNRGVEKRLVFLDSQDYNLFLYYLFVYAMSPDKIEKIYPKLPPRLLSKNLSSEVDLIAYCLMPNHFHFLITQKSKDGVSKFMKQLINAYTAYFNKKYDRSGALMQGRFKAARVYNDEMLMHVSRYIHLNPLIANLTKDPRKYMWSSAPYYLGENSNIECNKEKVLFMFSSIKAYESFMLDQKDYAKELKRAEKILIDH
ncbi:transposase [Patescibacteria group bacterium]|nr:transposase [Patescibacteria group bacterium]